MTTTARITYGNLSDPTRKGLLGLSLTTFFLGMGGIFIALMFFVFVEWWIGALIALGWVLALLPTAIPVPGGRNLYQALGTRIAFRTAERSGVTRLVGGPAGKVPDGSFRLPGIATQSEVSSHQTAFGLPFAMVTIPSTHHHSVVLEVHPAGRDLIDQTVIDNQVAQWAAWLANLGQESDIVAASVTVETSVDSGLRLRRSVLSEVQEDASDFSKAVAGELANGFGAVTPSISTRVSITFNGRSNGHSRSVNEMGSEIANKLPSLMDGLSGTGAGSHVRPCTAADLVDYVRAAYDPTVATQIEEARAAGGTGLSWDQAGPAYHDAQFDHYIHDRGVSVSWTLGGVPRGTFYDTSLSRLLSPDTSLSRKRVTLLYRPIPAERASAIADRKVRNANLVATSSRSGKAMANSVQRAANKTAEEEAEGAGMTLFGMVITATVDNRADDLTRARDVDLRAARQTIASQCAQARLRTRVALGSQDTAFVAGLPLGIVLPQHTTIPASVTDMAN